MDVFVTGGTGFIGYYVVNELLSKGHKVTILARNPRKIPSFAQNPNIKIIEGYIKDHEAIVEGLHKKDARMAIEMSGSKSKVVLRTDGSAVEGIMNCRPLPIDVSPIKDEFGFAFQSRERMRLHLSYLLAQ